ncbi:hypothetical protein B0H11DRAFT_1930563 [Mycena galericulata]|nr:hypothetical protein B0H11DRAFT_1930563 [Mycena galericulata]
MTVDTCGTRIAGVFFFGGEERRIWGDADADVVPSRTGNTNDGMYASQGIRRLHSSRVGIMEEKMVGTRLVAPGYIEPLGSGGEMQGAQGDLNTGHWGGVRFGSAQRFGNVLDALSELPAPSGADSIGRRAAWIELVAQLEEFTRRVLRVHPEAGKYFFPPLPCVEGAPRTRINEDMMARRCALRPLLGGVFVAQPPVSIEEAVHGIITPMYAWRDAVKDEGVVRRMLRGYSLAGCANWTGSFGEEVERCGLRVEKFCVWTEEVYAGDSVARGLARRVRLVRDHSMEHSAENFVNNVLATVELIRLAKDVDTCGPIDADVADEVWSLDNPSGDEVDCGAGYSERESGWGVQKMLEVGFLLWELLMRFGIAALVDPALQLRSLLATDLDFLRVVAVSGGAVRGSRRGEVETAEVLGAIIDYLSPDAYEAVLAQVFLDWFYSRSGVVELWLFNLGIQISGKGHSLNRSPERAICLSEYDARIISFDLDEMTGEILYDGRLSLDSERFLRLFRNLDPIFDWSGSSSWRRRLGWRRRALTGGGAADIWDRQRVEFHGRSVVSQMSVRL